MTNIEISSDHLCTFYLDRLYFGIPVQDVQEVIRYQKMTPVPLSSETVRGLINLRGQIVTAIDLRRRLGLPSLAEEAEAMNVVVSTDDGAVSLLVDEIGDVLHVEQSTWEPPPDTIAPEARGLVTGIYKLDRELLLVLDIQRAVDLST